MTGAISRGLNLNDFNKMTIGQIVDYCKTYNNLNKSEDDKENNDKTRQAKQIDFDRF